MINALEDVVFTSNVGYSKTGGSNEMTPEDAGAVNRHATFAISGGLGVAEPPRVSSLLRGRVPQAASQRRHISSSSDREPERTPL